MLRASSGELMPRRTRVCCNERRQIRESANEAGMFTGCGSSQRVIIRFYRLLCILRNFPNSMIKIKRPLNISQRTFLELVPTDSSSILAEDKEQWNTYCKICAEVSQTSRALGKVEETYVNKSSSCDDDDQSIGC